MDTQSLIQVYLINHPVLSNIFQGHYEQLMKCETSEDLIIFVTKIYRTFFMNDFISFDLRFQLFKTIFEFKPSSVTTILFPSIETIGKKYINDLIPGIKYVLKEFMGTDCENEEQLKNYFYCFLKNIKKSNENHYDVSEIIDPFYIDRKKQFSTMKIMIKENISKLNSNDLFSIVNLIDKNKLDFIDEYDFEFDIDSLTFDECLLITKIINKK